MDACERLTAEICHLVNKRLEVDPDKVTFKAEVQKERVRMTLNRDEYVSVFGDASTESILSDNSLSCSQIRTSEVRAGNTSPTN